jgi:hypothetical protein
MDTKKIPASIKVLSVLLYLFGLLAFFGSLFLWGQGFLFAFPEGVDLAYPVTDLLVNAPATFIAAIGLWRMKRFGYVAAQFVAGFYIYASVEIFVQMLQEGPPYPPEIFGPQILAVLVAIGLLVYPNRYRRLFE